MSLKKVTIHSQHGVERLFTRATEAQKALIRELRENKNRYIRKEEDEYLLYEKGVETGRVLNNETVDVLLAQGFLVNVSPHSNKIDLAIKAR